MPNERSIQSVSEKLEKNLEKKPVFDQSYDKALAIAKAVIDKKAENVKVLDLSGLCSFTDYFIICSGLSDRQVQAIADSVEYALDSKGNALLSKEGYSEGRWVLLDFGDVVVHVFLDALRDYYNLETFWASAPKVKIPSEFYGPAGTIQRLN